LEEEIKLRESWKGERERERESETGLIESASGSKNKMRGR